LGGDTESYIGSNVDLNINFDRVASMPTSAMDIGETPNILIGQGGKYGKSRL
jgi:hypothetical protein